MGLCMLIEKKLLEHLSLYLNGYKTKGKYINGLPDGLFERYYPDGSIFYKR